MSTLINHAYKVIHRIIPCTFILYKIKQHKKRGTKSKNIEKLLNNKVTKMQFGHLKTVRLNRLKHIFKILNQVILSNGINAAK